MSDEYDHAPRRLYLGSCSCGWADLARPNPVLSEAAYQVHGTAHEVRGIKVIYPDVVPRLGAWSEK